MQLLGKPKNHWGWLRMIGLGGLALVLLATGLATGLAALLRAPGSITWLSSIGYTQISLTRGLELAMIPLLAAIIGGWLEHQHHAQETEQRHNHAAEQAAAAQRKAALKQVHEAIIEAGHDAAKIRCAVEPALNVLDPAGKAELLHFLSEHGLLGGETSADLRGLDFSKIQLHRAHLQGGHLHGAHLDGVMLVQAQFDGAHLGKASLRGANLHRARLRHADLRESALEGCDLSGARLEHANLEGADLREAHLDGAFLSHANLRGCLGLEGGAGALAKSVLIETTLPDGSRLTNEKGKEYLRNKEIQVLIDRL